MHAEVKSEFDRFKRINDWRSLVEKLAEAQLAAAPRPLPLRAHGVFPPPEITAVLSELELGDVPY